MATTDRLRYFNLCPCQQEERQQHTKNHTQTEDYMFAANEHTTRTNNGHENKLKFACFINH